MDQPRRSQFRTPEVTGSLGTADDSRLSLRRRSRSRSRKEMASLH